jgi:restriction system protein
MELWEYHDTVRDLDWQTASSADCLFCKLPLLHTRPLDPWDIDDPMMGSVVVGDVRLCRSCGWWTATRSQGASWPIGNDIVTSITRYGAAGSLKELGFSDIQPALWEVRTFLQQHFERNAAVHPRLFEETVVSVFKSLGYDGYVTAYHNDKGIDGVIYKGTEPPIGIQVKQSKNKIEAEQIRSFAGALVLHGLTKGVFVTTSAFTSGARSTVTHYQERLIRVELIDAPRFLSALGLAQRSELPSRDHALALLANLKELSRYTSPPPESLELEEP